MPIALHIAWENLDTVIELASPKRPVDRKFQTPGGLKVQHLRVLNADHTRRYEILNQGGDLIRNLVASDPEIDYESAGKSIDKTYFIYVDKEFNPAFSFTPYDVMTPPSGDVAERIHTPLQPNTNEAIPLKIAAPRFKPLEVATRFVIFKSYFLLHSDGVSYRFLYEIAKTLHDANLFSAVTAHDPATMKRVPLILFRGKPSFPAAFLEGHVTKDAYSLILHLSRQELKAPMAVQAGEGDSGASTSGRNGDS